MRCLLMHAKEFKTTITGLATRPQGIRPEPVKHASQHIERAIVAWITVEESDQEGIEHQIANDLQMFAKQTGEKMIVLVPFAHLSNRLASSSKALQIFFRLENCLQGEFQVERTHFGSDKDLLLYLFGHSGNVRFREYGTRYVPGTRLEG